jgi:hypothetical protein
LETSVLENKKTNIYKNKNTNNTNAKLKYIL